MICSVGSSNNHCNNGMSVCPNEKFLGVLEAWEYSSISIWQLRTLEILEYSQIYPK